MKAQHQIKFGRKRSGTPREKNDAKVARNVDSVDVTGAQVVVGERELKFARALSDTEKEVRDASLESLRTWLSENAQSLVDTEIDRLWKALFYCVWMADKRPVITATIASVVDLADIVGTKFLEGLFRCLVREWFGIDKHRVDKYYELINVALVKSTEGLVAANTDEKFLEETAVLLKMLDKAVWSRVPKAGLGVALHVLDVYRDKVMRPVLIRAAKLSGNEVHKVFDSLLEQLYAKMGSSGEHSVAVGNRIQERVFKGLIPFVGDKDVLLTPKDRRDMMMRASKRIFAIAADKKTSDELRKDLYAVRAELKTYVTLYDEAKEAGRSNGKTNGRNKKDKSGRRSKARKADK